MAVPTPIQNTHGLTAQGTEVEMSWGHQTDPTRALGANTIWTQGASSCSIIATYDRANGQRTMYHPSGGFIPDGYYTKIANLIHPNTTVIVGAGSFATERGIGSDMEVYQKGFAKAMQAVGKTHTQLEWKKNWISEKDAKSSRLELGTLVLQANEQYGFKKSESTT